MYFLRKKNLTITVIFLLSIIILSAQEGNWSGYTACYQTRDIYKNGDYLWISTLGGIVKVNTANGEKEVFTTANSGLNSNFITCVFKDSNDNLWIGTDMYYGDWTLGNEYSGGLHKWSADDEWIAYNTANSDLPSNTVQKIIEDLEGNIWVLLERGGILKINTDESWEIFNLENSILNTNNFTDVKLDESGILWFSGFSYYNSQTFNYEGGGLFSYDGSEWIDHTSQIDPPSNQHDIFSIDIDSAGNIWLAASYDGYYCYDRNEFTSYQPPIMNGSGVQGSTREIALDENDVLYLGTTSGFYCFDGNIWRFFDHDNSTIKDNVIDNIITDDNIVWLGGYYYGFFSYSNNEITEIELNTADSELPSIFIYDVECDRSGKVWIASGSNLEPQSEDGLVSYDEGVWEHFGYWDFQNTLVNDILINEDELYLASGNDIEFGGVINYSSGIWERYDYIAGYPYVAADKVIVDQDGTIWSLRSSPSGGIAYFNGFEWEVYNSMNSPLTVNAVNDIVEDPFTNTLWIASADGIFHHDPLSGNWQHYSIPEVPEMISPEYVALYIDDSGKLWAGSQTGLLVYENGNWTSMNHIIPVLPNGYPTGVTKIIQDEYNCYWISTISGLVRYDGETNFCFNTQNSQLPTNVINALSSDLNGKIWVSTPACGLYCLENNFVSADNEQLETTPDLITEIGNYPNPFNPTTAISFNLKERSNVVLEIYNQKGQKVKTLIKSELPSGSHSFSWNGNDQLGRPVSSGIYFYKIKSDQETQTRKICLMK